MQVFISDMHLTDGSSGLTITPGALRVFAENLKTLVRSVKSKTDVTELKIVLLGDIFDVIRSADWLGTSIRPWSPKGVKQEAVVKGIVTNIVSNKENVTSLSHLLGLGDFAKTLGIPFAISYVIGNHDWLINRYPSCQAIIRKALGMRPDPGQRFPVELLDPAYRTFARHGDRYDDFNYTGDRDKSSIGDAIVIELLNRFPDVVGKTLAKLVAKGGLAAAERQGIVDHLKELDNVRPLLDVPSWIEMVMARTLNSSAREVIEDSWQACVDDFFKVPFIAKMDVPFWPDTIDMLQIALQLSSHTSKGLLEKVVAFKNRICPSGLDGDYHRRAFEEPALRSGEAKFVLYGHTHDHVMVPLDQVAFGGGQTQDKVYFNTGTWRHTWNKVAFDTANREFIGWKVLTYVAFYNNKENADFDFEVWSGALG
jgi:UDP-2,3-diacylglucosamine pyrophosphatase LpxH